MRQLGLKPSDTELEDIMNEIDSDHSGTIDFNGILLPQIYFYSKKHILTLTSYYKAPPLPLYPPPSSQPIPLPPPTKTP